MTQTTAKEARRLTVGNQTATSLRDSRRKLRAPCAKILSIAWSASPVDVCEAERRQFSISRRVPGLRYPLAVECI
ncbi:hypothetical protein QR680_003133 [Steinernema hermaphroditum]|uniref:Uncharacterized protein n=1 Tax=Steinernema hermaphroditum TaxID=289476 RepID=A0AA39H5J1_9BILA|nr:hypothetical protein QR680_003133 [Steinernema hermaphroditum]